VPSYAHNAPVDDPEQVPIRNAATVMIVRDQPTLQVLLVQRTSRAVFGPSAWVFPGGRVDPDDAADFGTVMHGISDEQASALLEVPAHGRAWWVAGLRETLEEAGLLLGVADAPIEVIEATRDAVHADAGVFGAALADHDLSLDLSALHEVARFITPLGPPRRFDTRFFVAVAPAGQVAQHDQEEVVQHLWLSPTEAIDMHRRGDLPLMSVTHRMLACLARYANTDELIQVAQERRPTQRVRVNDPDGAYEVVLPGEPGYETAELEIEHGWVRI
jgi:8-oxo-dGTP pyrophosphatase MutT (NUDIX family)